jgi:hypothetical protein
MENVIAIAGVAGVIVASVGLALWIEWFCLCGLLHLVPVAHHPQQSGKVSA